ncbi:ECF transporter S component [Clostridium ganghwense]|uniref:ECF transporter S component n=1 Tax=Clostridium ganghwense TaxID=312089 RepID=A0ABT4CQL3_9CLOT|nr:ECF transporter S component [Clostridium ganghwense]MCY6371348.1 ECF transporter S component [Clostridium ganghwense]
MQKTTNVQQLVRASLIIALGMVLPMFFHIFGKDAGAVFLPMHIPILIGGFILNPMYALLTGLITPLLSHFFMGMPAFPFVYVMMFELGTYGLFVSLLYNKTKIGVYPSLIVAMIIGRIVNITGIYTIIHMIMRKPFNLKIVAAGLFIKGLPGIVIQLIFIPLVIYAIKRSLISGVESRGY